MAEPFGLGKARRWELGDLARTAGADFSVGVLAAVDTDRGEARFTSGAVIEYDALLIASGARAQQAVEGALAFRGPADAEPFRALLDELGAAGQRGSLRGALRARMAAADLQLALLSAREFEQRDVDVRVGLVTSETLSPGPLRDARQRDRPIAPRREGDRGLVQQVSR